jgi:sulfur-oxidizing protein SoxA
MSVGGGRRAALFAALAVVCVQAAMAGEIAPAERRSGFTFMSTQTQAMQRDDTLNPGMLWTLQGSSLWVRKDGGAGKACADCHGDATQSMRGVAARYPAFDEQEKRPLDLQGRVNACRERHQKATPLPYESAELLGLVAYVAYQSRGIAVAPPPDERLTPFRERGKALYETRLGQLNFSCAQCHDERWRDRLASAPITQGHPTGYPIYRLEWQAVGSLQRRFRNCLSGVRAEPFPYGAPEYVELELYLAERAHSLPVETPAVRP